MLYEYDPNIRHDMGATIGADWTSPLFNITDGATGANIDLTGSSFAMTIYNSVTGAVVSSAAVTTIHSPPSAGLVHFELTAAQVSALSQVELSHLIVWTNATSFDSSLLCGDFNLFSPPFQTPFPNV